MNKNKLEYKEFIYKFDSSSFMSKLNFRKKHYTKIAAEKTLVRGFLKVEEILEAKGYTNRTLGAKVNKRPVD